MFTGNPNRDFDLFDACKEEKLSHLPKCDYCEEPIQDERFYLIRDEKVCEDCAKQHFYVWTDDYMEE